MRARIWAAVVAVLAVLLAASVVPAASAGPRHPPVPERPGTIRHRSFPTLPEAELGDPWSQRVRLGQRKARVAYQAERRILEPRRVLRKSHRPVWPTKAAKKRQHRPAPLGTTPAAKCDPSMYLQPDPNLGVPQLVEHSAALLIKLNKADAYDYGARIYGPGTATYASCPSAAVQANTINTSATTSLFFAYTGPHTVISAVNYNSTALSPPPIWTSYYPTALWNAANFDMNPFYDDVASGVRFAKAFQAGTGVLEVWDTLDWLAITGGCQQCDLHGYTVESATLSTSNGGLGNGDLSGMTFRNVTFGPGFNFGSSNLTGARFENVTFGTGAVLSNADLTGVTFSNVTMPSPVLTGANLTNAVFTGTNSVSAPQLTGAKLDGISLSAGTTISGATIGKANSGGNCTTATDADLTVGVFTVSTVAACPGTVIFAGSLIRPSAIPLPTWTSLNWSRAILVFEPSTVAYLKGANLSGLQLSGATFWGTPADLTGTNLSRAVLDGATLNGATMVSANLEGVSGKGAYFTGANLSKAKLDQPQGMTTIFDKASFRRATLDGATFNSSLIRGAYFTGASAHGPTDFGNAQASSANFDGIHVLGNPTAFAGVDFAPDQSAGFPAAVSFGGAVLGGDKGASTGISFENANLAGANFKGAQCISCAFTNTNLTNVDFQQAYIEGATFSKTTLDDTLFGDTQTSSSTGIWTFALGLAESATGAYAVNYQATSFTGAASQPAVCPSGGPPDPTNACLTEMNGHPPKAIPDCSAAGLDACPTMVSTSIDLKGTAGPPPAQVSSPQAIAVAPNGDTFVADAGNHVVVQVQPDGQGVPIAGTGQAGDAGDGGPALAATLNAPTGLALGADGTTLYLSDAGSHRIRKLTRVVNTGDGSVTYTISAVAGSGQPCADLSTSCGDGDDPLAAQFNAPAALWVDPVDHIYVADTGDNRIRVVIPKGGVGTVQNTGLSGPAGIAGDQLGNLYVANTNGATVLRYAPNGAGVVVLGNGKPGYNGTYTTDPLNPSAKQPKLGTTAQTNLPRGLATNLANQVIVAEAGIGIVRRISTSGYVAIVAGKTNSSDTATDTTATPDNLYANQTGFKSPVAVAATADGHFFVSDTGYYRVRTFGPYPTS